MTTAAAALAFAASPASAATVTTNCASLGSTFSTATAGETIVLNGMCTGAHAHYTLPAVSNLTIEGASGTTSGFDGTGVANPALSGTGAAANGLTLRNLTFQNYTLTGNSAVTLAPANGTLPTIDSDHGALALSSGERLR